MAGMTSDQISEAIGALLGVADLPSVESLHLHIRRGKPPFVTVTRQIAALDASSRRFRRDDFDLVPRDSVAVRMGHRPCECTICRRTEQPVPQ